MTATSHGHHIDGTPFKDDRYSSGTALACGGPTICRQCALEAAVARGQALVVEDVPESITPIDSPPFEDTSDYDEDPDRFLKYAKQYVVGAHAVETAETGAYELKVEDLYIVWFTKVLENWKALISTSIPGDGLYFEVTRNGAKAETYVDTYRKSANNVFSHHDF